METQKGLRVRLEDEGEGFSEYLPCEGTILAGAKDKHGTPNWSLLQLDEPIEYQLKVGEPFQYRLVHVSKLLIRSRFEGESIGCKAWTSVHVLLPIKEGAAEKEVVDLEAFYHVAWARCLTG